MHTNRLTIRIVDNDAKSVIEEICYEEILSQSDPDVIDEVQHQFSISGLSIECNIRNTIEERMLSLVLSSYEHSDYLKLVYETIDIYLSSLCDEVNFENTILQRFTHLSNITKWHLEYNPARQIIKIVQSYIDIQHQYFLKAEYNKIALDWTDLEMSRFHYKRLDDGKLYTSIDIEDRDYLVLPTKYLMMTNIYSSDDSTHKVTDTIQICLCLFFIHLLIKSEHPFKQKSKYKKAIVNFLFEGDVHEDFSYLYDFKPFFDFDNSSSRKSIDRYFRPSSVFNLIKDKTKQQHYKKNLEQAELHLRIIFDQSNEPSSNHYFDNLKEKINAAIKSTDFWLP